MKVRSNYVSNSSSSSFIVSCNNKKQLDYIRSLLNEYLSVMYKFNSSIDASYEFIKNGKSIELITTDGDYICQEAVRNIQNWISVYGIVDEEGDPIEFTTEEIYMG